MKDIIIVRQRLLDEAEQDGPRILVFYGPMGYGKTTLLDGIYRQKQNRAVLCRMVQEDSRFEVLAGKLAAAVRQICPDFSFSREPDAEEAGTEEDMESVACELGRAICALKNPPEDIILDDFQEIKGEEAGRFLALLFLALPQNTRFLIATRDRIPGFALRYLADGTSRVFCSQMMSFTEEEVEEAVKKAGISRLAETAAAIWKRTQGWPAGVMMILFALKNNWADGGEEAVEKLCLSPVMKRLIKYEILDRQPEEMGRFMISISPIQKPGTELCRCALGIENAREKLLWLFQRGLLYQWKRGSGEFEWNPLLRGYLQSLLPKAEKDRILNEAARWFLEQGRIQEAADCAVQAGGREILERILTEQGYSLLAKGKVEVLEQCLEFLLKGKAGESQGAFILLLEGLVHRERGREQAQLRAFERALWRADGEQQTELFARALFCTARCLAERGEADRAEVRMREGIAKKLTPHTFAWYEGMLGWAYIWLYAGREKEALQVLDHALRSEAETNKTGTQKGEAAERCQSLRLQAADLAEILRAYSSLNLREILERIDQEAAQRRIAGSLCAAKLILSGGVGEQEIAGLLKRLNDGAQTALHARARMEGGYMLFEQGRWEEGGRQICRGIEALNRMHLYVQAGNSGKNFRMYQIYAALSGQIKTVGSGVHLAAQCFGEFYVQVLETGEKIRWRTKKARDCMAFLLHQGSRGASRSELMDALWEEEGPGNEVAALHNILSSIRKSFSEYVEEVIICRDKRYFVQPEIIYTDIGLAEEIAEAVQKGEPQRLLPWQGMLELLSRGSYLADVDGEWAEQMRYYYERYIYEGLAALGTCHMDRGEFTAAEFCLRRAIAVDPYSLKAIAGLMNCYGKMKEGLRLTRFYEEIRTSVGEDLEQQLETEMGKIYKRNLAVCGK